MRYVGVDLSTRAFTACFLEEDETYQIRSYPLIAEGLGQFRAQLGADDRLAVEVGSNAFFFHDQVCDAVAQVVLVSTRQFALIAQSKKKTDRNDALILARFLRLDCLPTVAMPDRRTRELRELFAAREGIVKMVHQLKNIGHAALARNGIASSRSDFASARGRGRLARLDGLPSADRRIVDMTLRQIESLERELTELEQAIIQAGKSLPGLKRLLQIRGVGLVAAIGILAEIGDVNRFQSAKQLASYAGLVASVRQSGATDRHGHITKEGRRLLRGYMVEAVLSLIRNPSGGRSPLAEFYQRKKQEKGAGKAIVATARKLLTIVYVLLTKELDFWFLEERLYQRKLGQLAAAWGDGDERHRTLAATPVTTGGGS
jgi:transposase